MELVAVQGAMSLIPGAADAWNALRAEVYAKYRVSLFLSSPGGAWRSDQMVRDMYFNPSKYGATKGVAKPRSLGGPGSVHENGRCIDINNWAAVGLKNLEPIAARHQFVRTIPKEQWHFEYRGPEGGGGGGAKPKPERKRSMTTRYALIESGDSDKTFCALAGENPGMGEANWIEYRRGGDLASHGDLAVQEAAVHGPAVWVTQEIWDSRKTLYTRTAGSVSVGDIVVQSDPAVLDRLSEVVAAVNRLNPPG